MVWFFIEIVWMEGCKWCGVFLFLSWVRNVVIELMDVWGGRGGELGKKSFLENDVRGKIE